MMVRIQAHLAGTTTHDENTGETITLIALIAPVSKEIVSGTYFGQIVELAEPYPFRFDIRSNPEKTGFYFGMYSKSEDSHVEEVYRTNLHKKRLERGEYFSVISSDSTDFTYVIDHVVDMAAHAAGSD